MSAAPLALLARVRSLEPWAVSFLACSIALAWWVVSLKRRIGRRRVVRRRLERLATEFSRASEETFLKIFQSVPEGIVISGFGRDGVLDLNRRFESISGYSRKEILGRTLAHVGLVMDPLFWYRLLARLRSEGSLENVEYQMRRKGGEIRTISWSAEVIELSGRTCFVSVHRDVSVEKVAAESRKRAELEHRQLMASGSSVPFATREASEVRLRDARDLETVGRFAGRLAHDFDNLLTVMLGSADLAEAGLDAASPARRDLEEIRRAAIRARALTRDLATFGRRDIVSPAVVDLNALLERLRRLLQLVAGDSIELQIDPHPRAGRIEADPDQLEQVVINLVVNARDAMPTGGTLRIATAPVDVHQRPTCGARGGPFVRLTVSDTGCGMTPEVQARIFVPWFTTKPDTTGTGLGLSIVRSIVQQAGGHVTVASTPGCGSTFAIDFPRLTASS